MNGIKVIGVDLAKNVFELNGADAGGKTIFRKRLKRSEMAEFFVNLPSCRVAMEACGGAHHWARLLSQQGHQPQLIAAQFVKPFRNTTQKNDRNDAQAIVEASLRTSMKYVAPKSLQQQDMQSLHRVRQQLIDMRVMMGNQIRGLLMEYGIVMDRSFAKFKAQIAQALEDGNTELTPLARELISAQATLLLKVYDEQKQIDAKLQSLVLQSEDCQRLMEVPGVGINSASMFLASVGDGSVFKNGRHVAAWIGLVPRQYSSGEQQRAGRITRAGEKSLRAMLVNGARAGVLSSVRKQEDTPQGHWIRRLVKEKGWNKATVALAHRNACVMFHLLKYKTVYKAA